MPSIVSVRRNHKDITYIILVNIVFGWTFLGWIICLFWALNRYNSSESIVFNNNIYANPATQTSHPQSFVNNLPQLEISNTNAHKDKIAQLKEIKELLDEGILTQAEYEQQKSKILI